MSILAARTINSEEMVRFYPFTRTRVLACPLTTRRAFRHTEFMRALSKTWLLAFYNRFMSGGTQKPRNHNGKLLENGHNLPCSFPSAPSLLLTRVFLRTLLTHTESVVLLLFKRIHTRVQAHLKSGIAPYIWTISQHLITLTLTQRTGERHWKIQPCIHPGRETRFHT